MAKTGAALFRAMRAMNRSWPTAAPGVTLPDARPGLAPAIGIDAPPRRVRDRFARATLLGSTDALMLGLATTVAYVSWAAPVLHQPAAVYLELWPVVLLFIAGYARAGLYPGLGLGPVERLRRLTYVTTSGFLVLAAFSFALKLPPLYSRVTVALAFVLSLLFVPIGL